MKPIKAFVGHSFTGDDEDVVRVFLRYFDDIKRFNIGFDWVHAESAEPLDLRDKVLKLADGANLFIGICTSKERAIGMHVLKPKWLFKTFLCAPESAFIAKTSDWVIQEIGFAIGKGMRLLLLVEEGLRQPGGLQGNVEYITFSRNAPERSFGRILQMIQALLADGNVGGVQSQEQPQSKEQDRTDSGDTDEDQSWTQPQIDWVREDYAFALMRAMATKNADLEKTINDSYLATPGAKELDNAHRWEAERAYFRIIFYGDGSAVSVIQRLADEKPRSAEVLTSLGHAYRSFKEHKKAGETYREAADVAKDVKQRLDILGSAATEFVLAEELNSAAKVIDLAKESGTANEQVQLDVLKIVRNYAAAIKNDELYMGVSEKILSISPGDTDIRFSLAYKYADLNNHQLALFHYSRTISRDRSQTVWNNLGVAYDNLKLKINAIDAYRKSEASGETLAMSNLATSFLQAGFKDEARALCHKAIAIPEHNKRVPTVLVSVDEEIDREDKKIKELESESNAIHSYFVQFGESGLKKHIEKASGIWHSPRCNLEFTIANLISYLPQKAATGLEDGVW